MTTPVESASSAAREMYALLPDHYRDEDAANGYTGLHLVEALTSGLSSAHDFLGLVDAFVDPYVTPREWLPFLGALVGVDVSAWPTEIVRDVVAAAITSRVHGSRAAIAEIVALTLSSPTPPPRVWANFSGNDPFDITVVTNTAQTPDPVATLQAALTEKPFGIELLLQIVDGAIIAEYMTAYPTIAEAMTALPTCADLVAWFPTT